MDENTTTPTAPQTGTGPAPAPESNAPTQGSRAAEPKAEPPKPAPPSPAADAVMECFFRYLKHEETNRRSYVSLHELQDTVFRYIHGFYNTLRPHSHNNGLPPIAAEEIVP
ncbi:MAG: integrase core domain-containing protein [Oscillospiraceae bacterium]|nr:integrase core domain-containing protein [Oscillospiraceae bacterium]